MCMPKIFISYHRADMKYKNNIVAILREHGYHVYCVNEKTNFNGLSHQDIANRICSMMDDCDILLCIVGKETYTRPHVDWEIHTALKGNIDKRKGIIAVMLENRRDSKNDVNLQTFPTKLQENFDYIVLEQYATIEGRIDGAIDAALENSKDARIHVTHRNPVMKLRTGLYFDN